jgi:hypothetical protein
MIVVTVEGGLVQSVSSDDPILVGREVVVIDYDAEGADPGEIACVPQPDGKAEDALVHRHAVGRLSKKIARFLKARLAP